MLRLSFTERRSITLSWLSSFSKSDFQSNKKYKLKTISKYQFMYTYF